MRALYASALTVLMLLFTACASIRPNPLDISESYHMYLSPTFASPCDLLIEHTQEGTFLTRQEYRGAGGYDPKPIGPPYTRRLSEDQWMAFIRIIGESKFWTADVTSYYDIGLVDGNTVWFLAYNAGAAKNIRFHDPFSSTGSQSVRLVVEAFLDLEKDHR